MSQQFIKFTKDQGVAEITLNRPDKLNSFHTEMAKKLQGILAEVKDDSSIRAVLLCGEGRAFCAGQDLGEAVSDEADIGRIVRENYNPIILAIRKTEKPFICAVNGVAAGAGANLALACDIVLASEDASFIQAFCKIGLIPDGGGTFFLPRLVGFGRASALAMTADKVSAARAEEIGLIYKVTKNEELLSEARALAQELATQPTRSFGLIKRAFNASMSNSLEEQLGLEEKIQSEAGQTKDYNEGISAFLEKRAPKFIGE